MARLSTRSAEQAPAFLTAAWRDLAIASYEIDPAALASRVPAGTELDTTCGCAQVSVVGFRFLHTRVLGVSVPGHTDFDEVNLRFYVRRRGPEGWRRGVVFVKEIVPRVAIAWVANALYREHYVALPMRHRIELADPESGAAGALGYEWRHAGAWDGLSMRTRGAATVPDEDSEECFIAEHYWGYAARAGARTIEYRVEHPRWRVWRAEAVELRCRVEALYGPEFAEALAGPPRSAFVAAGSEVTVRRGVAIQAPARQKPPQAPGGRAQ